MSASLVGSEMCIRDRFTPLLDLLGARAGVRRLGPAQAPRPLQRAQSSALHFVIVQVVCSRISKRRV
eukprot:3904680-Alexandrium_andersonii.AAC.1